MANRYGIIGVEGPYDRFFIAALLVRHGFSCFDGNLANLDGFWVNLKPAWPKNGKLYGRPEMPQIVHKSGTSVAICAGEGANLLNQFPDTFKNRPQYKTGVAAFGIVADADTEASADVAKKYAAAYRPHFPYFPNAPGVVDTSAIRSGVFVLPDNTNNGTLEDILLECGGVGYPDLTAKARSFVGAVDRNVLSLADKEGLSKRAGEKKAVVSCIGSVLRPGLTLDNSIRKDRWLEAGALALPRVDALTKFLRDLIVF
jgi:hypothetical protein